MLNFEKNAENVENSMLPNLVSGHIIIHFVEYLYSKCLSTGLVWTSDTPKLCGYQTVWISDTSLGHFIKMI